MLDVLPNGQACIQIFQNIGTSTEYGIEGDLVTNRKIGIEFRCVKVVKITDMLYQLEPAEQRIALFEQFLHHRDV